MKKVVIYLCGGMTKFGKENFDMANYWRISCKNELTESSSYYGCDVEIINPNEYFNFIEDPKRYESEREVMEYDINKVRHSNLIICNFNDPGSLGTMAELAIAYENRIPIIGLSENNEILHPWQIEFCTRIFTNMSEMLEYVKDFYLL